DHDVFCAGATGAAWLPSSPVCSPSYAALRVSGVVSAADLALACHRSALGLPMRTAEPQPESIPGITDTEARP
ncbi:hypothetical protein, partial [Nocardia brasiliensis]|uniref:hypothetical protein n=1 Tax=Nocardia brasiliensis TaxID=37326 RepID=UPI002457977C